MQSRDLDLWRVFWRKSQTRAPSLGSECQPKGGGRLGAPHPPKVWYYI